ncbi:GNAT family N-acetyltransferase [Pseudoduganella lutea]|uniref:N-acetyltransferase n=1 Tax=Pseudoduganella lutea TaxID=321985 RepID=A0A4P6L455_9BURK|nr:GNAT family N-acetyltransferase [Pseudoduganella lutea]QBE66361.1 N-acetyltransferase [Pseudoduganella lutea]
MSSIDIRYTEKFPEPEFSSLQRSIFAEIERIPDELDSVLRSKKIDIDSRGQHQAPKHRFGAYDGEELVGWTYGWFEHNNVFYMANSGIKPTHRRKGVYTALLNVIRSYALEQGAWCIRSQHSVVNNAVIIAKLRAAFHITGLHQSGQMGTLVELTQHLSDKHEQMFRDRVMPYGIPKK